jgi:hypothetical protein
VAGRKLVPVFAQVDATSPATIDSQYQAACSELTQDHKIFVLFAGQSEVLIQCAHNAGAVAITANLTAADAAIFQRFPYYVEIRSLNLDRVAAAEVAGLNAQGYFSGWDAALAKPGPGKAKIGVIVEDRPSFVHAAEKVLVPALAKLGYGPDPANVVRVPRVERTTDVGPIAAAVSNAVLKFRSNGVEHVMILEPSGVVSLLFANNADSQRYYPRFGANSQNGLQALVDSGGFPKSELRGTVGIGWLPSLDITPSENTVDGPYSTDARRRCMNLFKAKGVTFSDSNAQGIAIGNCDELWFFEKAGNGVSGPLTRDALMASLNRIGSTFQSADTFATRFSASQHDGVAAIRYWAHVPSCDCMRYTSGNVAVP